MGFQHSILRFFYPRKKEDEKRFPEDDDRAKKPRNFMYLDSLIHRGEKEIILDADIVLDEYEEPM